MFKKFQKSFIFNVKPLNMYNIGFQLQCDLMRYFQIH